MRSTPLLLTVSLVVVALIPRGDASATTAGGRGNRAVEVGAAEPVSQVSQVRLRVATVGVGQGGDARSHHGKVGFPSSATSRVTMYNATWCSACKSLERGLKERDIPFDSIDVDQNPQAFQRAREATRSNSIPQTSVERDASNPVWIIGADVNAVERAYRN